ncbi:FAD binding domain protein [Pseudomassariella vexata]|uniref:FAD binding domain protein n=1 Tax=Pseudomassariella vexata TaxID=1141098 RepID=A0A1Y2DTS9_9PEZI|nr:FAD binding domain protein [Pseudomassariella vexata]ORY62579.1 FAD binding domain protein [Pseudomassariella vexata]
MAETTNGVIEVDLPIIYRDRSNPAKFYEAVWGRVFNGKRDTERRPYAVVQASNAAHVKAAVELAGRENCRVSVRSGGHSWAGWSVRDGAVLIDLGDLQGIGYDEETQIVSCSPSVIGRKLNAFLAEKGRLFAGGHCPDVGLGGFLLQGGMGWNCKNWGWACESIVGIDVVTADARELHCSKAENSDLFWAARGSGPGFAAVATRFHLMTRPLTSMFNCIYVYPISEYRKVLQWVVDLCPTADPDTEIVCVSRYAPGSDEIQITAGFTTWKPSRADAEISLKSIHDSRPSHAVVELFCDPTSLDKEYTQQAAANPQGHRYCSENAFVANDADVPAVLEAAFTTLPTKKSFALYFAMNPTSRRPLPDMALSMHSDHYFALYTVWKDPADDARCTGWVYDVLRDVERHAIGSYLGDADFQHRRTKFWSEESGKKLMEVRRKWDPEGRICGYLDVDDKSGVAGLRNEFEW